MPTTIEVAKNEIPDIDSFCQLCCDMCAEDGYCLTECSILEKARLLKYDLILKAYAKYDGDLSSVCKYIEKERV